MKIKKESLDMIKVVGGIIGFTLAGTMLIGIVVIGTGHTLANKESAMLIAGMVCIFIVGVIVGSHKM